MASISPFLQMLLGRNREALVPPSRTPPFVAEPAEQPSPTIPIRSRAPLNPDAGFDPRPGPYPRNPDVGFERPASVLPFGPPALAQEPTIPLSIKGAMPLNEGLATRPPELMDAGKAAPIVPAAVDPTIPIKSRSRVEEAADEVRRYDQGLHKDPKTGEWVEHKRNKGLQILEGLGTVAAGSVGIPLQRILHPRGTPEQQARRRLQTEVGLEDQSIQRQRAVTDIEGDKSTIALRSAQARKIDSDLAHPGISEERKAELELLKEGLRSHPGPFDPTNPDDAAFIKRLAAANYPINVASYGKKPKEAPKLVASRTRQTEDGKNIYIDDDGEPILDQGGQPIVHGVAKPDKASGESQEDADKREAEGNAVRRAAASARVAGDNINKELQPLYAERGTLESQLKGKGGINWDNTDKFKGPVKDSNEMSALKDSIDERLKEVRAKIAEQEKARDAHYTTATQKEAEVLRYERRPKAATAPASGRTVSRANLKRWSVSRWAAANPSGDVAQAKSAARAKGFTIVD